MRLRGGELYVAHGNTLRAVDAADGRELWAVALGARARAFIATSERLLAIVTAANEALVIDPSGKVLGRGALPELHNGRFALADDGTLTLLGTSGQVWSGRADALRAIARFPKGRAARGVVALSAAIALVTADDGQGRSVVHALELPTGRELWSHAVDGVLTEAPSVSGGGGVLLVSSISSAQLAISSSPAKSSSRAPGSAGILKMTRPPAASLAVIERRGIPAQPSGQRSVHSGNEP